MSGLVYIGDGSVWIQDGQPVPNRDLTANEVELYGGADALMRGGLYTLPIFANEPKIKIVDDEGDNNLEVDDGCISKN